MNIQTSSIARRVNANIAALSINTATRSQGSDSTPAFQTLLQRALYPTMRVNGLTQLASNIAATAIDEMLSVGFRDELLGMFAKLPAHLQVLLALHDDRAFQQRLAGLLGIDVLPDALDALRRASPTTEITAALVTLGAEHPRLLQAVVDAIMHYGLDESHGLQSAGFSEFAKSRYMRLIYLCASAPSNLPALLGYFTNGKFCGNCSHAMRHYHRAASFYVAMYEPHNLPDWLREIDRWLRSVEWDACAQFIAHTAQMAAEFAA